MDWRGLEEAGLYDPAAADAASRRELLEFLVAEGCSLEEMQLANSRGRLFALAGDRTVKPLVGLLTLREAAERLQVPPGQLQRLWRTFGLPDQGIDTPLLTDADVEACRTFVEISALIGEETALGVARVVGVSLARVTEAESSAMRLGMDAVDLARSSSELETARAWALVAQLVPRIGRMLDAMHRQHLEATRVHFEGIDVGERASFRCGVGFADLSGFTQLAHQLGLADLSMVLTVFEEQATQTVQQHGGRVVKFLGDAVMWVSGDAGDLAAAAVDLVTHPRAALAGVTLRAGIAHGLVLAQDGDYFGTPVNLASRLVAHAEAGEVLAAGELVEQLGAEWVTTRGDDAVLRGFDQPVPLFAVTRS